jgi:hypothetical protein
MVQPAQYWHGQRLRRSGRRGGPARPSATTGACASRCNIVDMISADDADAARQTLRHDQGNPAGLIRSASPHIRSAMVTVVRSADLVCHRSKPAGKDTAIDALPVTNDISRRLLPPVCLGQLPGNPFGARMRGYTQPQKLTSTVFQDQESVQHSKGDRWDQEQIHRWDAVGIITKEGFPALRRRHPHATVVCPTSMPSLISSPCIRGAPQSGFAMLISRMRRRMSAGVVGRPPRGRDFQRQ